MPLTATARVEELVNVRDRYEKFEGRFSNYGAFKAYRDQAEQLLPVDELSRQKSASNAVPIYLPVIQKQLLTVITARSCSITGNVPNSAKPTFTKITRGFEFTVYPKVSDNNIMTERQQFVAGLTNGLRSVAPNLDTYAAGLLESGKNTGLVTTTLTGLSIVSNAYQIALAQRDRLYYYIPSIMARNDLGGTMINIGTTESRELMLEYESRGFYNDENRRGVLEGDLPSATGYRHYTSNRITNGGGVSETHYLVQNGSIACFSYNDSDAVNRREGPSGMVMYTQVDPIFGIRWDVQEIPVCTDISATYGAGVGYEATLGTQYRYAADFVFVQAYSSDTTSPIIKLQVMTT